MKNILHYLKHLFISSIFNFPNPYISPRFDFTSQHEIKHLAPRTTLHFTGSGSEVGTATNFSGQNTIQTLTQSSELGSATTFTGLHTFQIFERLSEPGSASLNYC
jgi:hypothetical protein